VVRETRCIAVETNLLQIPDKQIDKRHFAKIDGKYPTCILVIGPLLSALCYNFRYQRRRRYLLNPPLIASDRLPASLVVCVICPSLKTGEMERLLY